ncbi:apolipoprotein N-acyltransferase [Mycobacterium sp. Marseille-P9652]|uniref:apolipoprotein N-acyltransferase n=1 Tax=Mycobacterium sp. Marseille-P9652 TaxID=2654950 RepID=UPI0012E7FAFF|nr:apolipoprotein N-acyltransferase [Mycobacterium sp. Marseille-P9652]
MVAGALPALAFPAPAWWWLAWFALMPLLMLVRAAPRPWHACERGWCGVTGFVLATQYWLAGSVGPVLVPLAAGVAALWLPWAFLTHRLLAAPPSAGRAFAAVVTLPCAWVAAEAARSWPPLGGAWAPLGASQWARRVTLASASLGGVWLTSWLVAAANTAVVVLLVCRVLRVRFGALACIVAAVAVGPVWYLLSAPEGGRTVRVALVQPGDIVDSGEREAAGEALTASLAGRPVDLVVWGESSVGADLDSHPEALARLSELSRRVGADILVNVDARAPDGRIRKSAVLVGPTGSLGSYRKTRLVPFGEYVPLRPLFGWITRFSGAAAEDRERGGGPVVLRADALAIGPLVSYETLFPDLARREALLGAGLLAYQSSTSSFQGSWAQPQLGAQPAVRAVEAGLPAVHAGSSGDSSAFDARGRRLAWCGSGFRGVVLVDVPLASTVTPYRRLGDWVPAVSLVLSAGALVRWRRPTGFETLP